MLTILISVLLSTIIAGGITIKITAAIKRELVTYVEEMCDLNIEQSQKIKDCALKTVEMLVRNINRDTSITTK